MAANITRTAAAVQRYKLVYFVPTTHLAQTKAAIFSPTCGTIGDYSQVAFITTGKGQFLPGEGAKPVIGKVGEIEEVEESRVEVVCLGEAGARKAVEKLKESHPYEEVAYDVYKLEDF